MNLESATLGAMDPTVSILLPARDAGTELAACLDSVRRQRETSFECVVLDDGSSDATVEIATAAASKDPRIAVIRRQHSGLVTTLNAGIERCRGDFVARMDADDWMHRDRLVLQLRAFEADPALDLVGAHVRMFPRDTLGDGSREYERWLNAMRTPQDLRRERFIECPLAHPGWMIRKETLVRLGGYRDAGWPEDYDLLLRLLEGGGRAGVVPHRLIGWRRHAEQLSRRDERYSLRAFTECRAAFLASGPLRETNGFLLWGYGQTGRALRRALGRHRKQLSGLIEVHPGRLGQKIHGAPVVSVEAIDRLPRHLLIVSVAGIGPRNEIRNKLNRSGRVEGRDYFCAA